MDSSSWFDFSLMFLFNLGLALLFFIIFSLLRYSNFYRHLHASRVNIKENIIPDSAFKGPFSWFPTVWNTSEKEIISFAGLDAAVFLRMFKFSIQFFIGLNFINLPLLLPLNAQGDELKDLNRLSSSNVPENSNSLWGHVFAMYITTAFTCFWMWKTYHHVWLQRHLFLKLRSEKLHPEEYFLFVHDIPYPPGMRSNSIINFFRSSNNKGIAISKSKLFKAFSFLRMTTGGLIKHPSMTVKSNSQLLQKKQIDTFFLRIYPQDYLLHQIVLPFRKVQKAYTQWMYAKNHLERTERKILEIQNSLSSTVATSPSSSSSSSPLPSSASQTTLHVHVTDEQTLSARTNMDKSKSLKMEKNDNNNVVLRKRMRFFGVFGSKVDVLQYWKMEESKKREFLLKEQKNVYSMRATGAAFVAFKSRKAAAMAAQTVHSIQGRSWKMEAASQPSDIIWSNVEFKLWERGLRRQIANVAFVLIIIFFYIPVTFIASLTTMEKLVTFFPFLKKPVQQKWFHGFVASLLPGLALRIILWIIPPTFLFFAKMEGNFTHSAVQISASTRHYYVLLFNVFLGYTFTGTLLSQLRAILDHPGEIVSLLANSIPQTASFFISYVVISGVLFGMELLRLPLQMANYLRLRLVLGTETALREKLWNQGSISYHFFVPYQNLIITFGVVFATVAPLILPFVLLYSLIGYVVWKHQILFVYSYPYQTGGMLWPHFVNHVFVALVISQLTCIGEMGLKQAFSRASVLFPLPFFTIYFLLIMNSRFLSSFSVLPLELAVAVDEKNESQNWKPDAEEFSGVYVPDCMKPIPEPELDSEPDLEAKPEPESKANPIPASENPPYDHDGNRSPQMNSSLQRTVSGNEIKEEGGERGRS